MRTRDLTTIDTYTAADRVLDGRNSRVIANNTRLVRVDPTSIAVRLHNTDVVTFIFDGRVILDDGGWPTTTTTQRMHAMTPANVRVNKRGEHLIVTVGEDKTILGGVPVVVQP